MATLKPTNTRGKEIRPSLWKVWVLAARPHTLTASLSPCLVGYSMAFTEQRYENKDLTTLFFRWFLFCISIQLATNLHNDYADFVKGADTDERLGQARATQKGWLSPMATLNASMGLIIVALAIGISLVPQDGGDSLFWFVLISSCINAFAYTGGPYPLGYIGLENFSIAYWGLGDLFCFFYFGVIATLAVPYLAFYSQNNFFLSSDNSILLIQALPASFLSVAIIVVNNLRDRHTDVLAQKKTLAVRFGSKFCRVEYTLLVSMSYLVALYNIIVTSSFCYALPFLTIPLAINGIKAIWNKDGRELNPFVGKTALLELMFCFFQSVAILLDKGGI
mmetsp:Transcript_16448/g.18956  ORF Transcript_16448/g.18956 Transcript_16448/m.18956 type:complete len:335 (-) Transcript_16448:88-1092(-)